MIKIERVKFEGEGKQKAIPLPINRYIDYVIKKDKEAEEIQNNKRIKHDRSRTNN